MTRINLIPLNLLSDQHLWAEHRELPRIFTYVEKHGIAKDIPERYCLGKGHVKFFTDKLDYLINRSLSIEDELIQRGRKPIYTTKSLIERKIQLNKKYMFYCWFPDNFEVQISLIRIMAKVNEKPNFYTWYGKKLKEE